MTIGRICVALLLAASGLLFSQATVPTKAAATYRIAGTVVHGVTGAPLARVLVSIAPRARKDQETSMVTGPDGRFGFAGVSAGNWHLKALRTGFAPHHYGQSPGVGSPGIAIITGPETVTHELVFRLYPPSVITGRITDEFGEPVVNALVQIYCSYVTAGRRRVRAVQSAWSDADGLYRVWQLPAGTYYVGVAATPWFAPRLQPGEGGALAGMGYEPQFFPGTSDPGAAEPFRLQPGEERTVDIRLRFSKAVKLRVAATIRERQLLLVAPGPGGTQMLVQRSMGGPFHGFSSVLPGRYRLVAVGDEGGALPRSQEIEVGTADMELRLALPEPLVVTASVQATGIPPEVLRKILLSLVSEERLTGDAKMVTPGEKIIFPGLIAGRYKVNLFGPREQVYLDSVSAQGARVELPLIELVEGQPAHLELTLKNDGGRVRGFVRAGGKAAAGVNVILTPREETAGFWSDSLFVTDLDGSFDFEGLKPGDYLLFTSDDPELEFTNPAVLRPHGSSATPIHVEPRSSQTLEIEFSKELSPQPAR